ncbi:MAG: aspartate kinase [Flavobacteriia bacterium]|nr:MAG: aspartate kinase [Flavobacteriia bacterium]
MKVFKFGGSSVSNAEGVKNITRIIQTQGGDDLVIVVSAMGKMTNAFEVLINAYVNEEPLEPPMIFIRDFHEDIMNALFDEDHKIFECVEDFYADLLFFLKRNTNKDYNYIYDRVVGYGELISTTIISHYFELAGLQHTWLDAHNLIKTDRRFRSANVDWTATATTVKQHMSTAGIYLTQGFISAADDQTFTTLGREGSDFSAAILSYILDAESMSIWKDVPGVLNADPRHFEHTQLLEKVSYREALEMAFYGATVIHPKTIKPLENKNIPLYVKSFINPQAPGTMVSKGVHIYPETTCYTFKDKQILLCIATRDFSFMIEHNISQVFELFTQHKIKVNLIQNTATSFTVCVDDMYNQFDALLDSLSRDYEITYEADLQLITLRHTDDQVINAYMENDRVLLVQQNDFAAQIVLKQ